MNNDIYLEQLLLSTKLIVESYLPICPPGASPSCPQQKCAPKMGKFPLATHIHHNSKLMSNFCPLLRGLFLICPLFVHFLSTFCPLLLVLFLICILFVHLLSGQKVNKMRTLFVHLLSTFAGHVFNLSTFCLFVHFCCFFPNFSTFCPFCLISVHFLSTAV